MTPDAGLVTLFALVLADSLGVPAPGDSALLVAGALVADGHVSLVATIAVASAAAMVGDTIVYWVGRSGGRRLLLRDGPAADRRRSALAKADRFYQRYGLIAVFFGKFVPGVRGVGALAAGASGMRWGAFAAVNAAACLAWTSTAVAAGYAAGPSVVLIVGVAAVAAGVVWILRRRSRPADH
ncbi:MAG: DedA family protein [Baekduiaceae bacterium]